jgi:hypothetical protein
MSKNFNDLEDFTQYIKNTIVGYIYDQSDINVTDYAANPQFVWGFNYGSMLYHPEDAKDYDVCLIMTSELFDIFHKIFDEHSFDTWTINEYPIDVKPTVFGDLDSSELLELDYNTQKELSSYVPACLNVYLSQDSVERLVKMTLADKKKVRHSISQKCSNSFVKAKKKLTVEKDYDRYSSMKSLYHSIRMAVFAYQYGKNGIISPESCKELYKEIASDYENNSDEELLELINTKYKKIYNEKMRLFRLFYPK